MSMFEKAARRKLRINTSKGLVTIEDLWDLSLTDLNYLAKGLNKKLKEQEEEDFLEEAKVGEEDDNVKLTFAIVLHVLKTKKSEADDRELAADKRAKKQKLLALLEKKQDEGLEGLSEAKLKKMIDEL